MHGREFSLREAIVETASRSLNTAASFTATAGLALPAIFSALLDDDTEASASAIISLIMALMISCMIGPIPGRLGAELNNDYPVLAAAKEKANLVEMQEMQQKIQEKFQHKLIAETVMAGASLLFLLCCVEPLLPIFEQTQAVNDKIVSFARYWAVAPVGLAMRMIPEQGLFASQETKHLPKFLALPWFLLFGVCLSAFLCFQKGWGLSGLAVGLSVELVMSAICFWAAFLLKQPDNFPQKPWFTAQNARGILTTFRDALPYFIQALSQTLHPLALEDVAERLNKNAFLARGILNRPGAIIAFPVVAMRQAVNQLLGPAKEQQDYPKMRQYVKAALILTLVASGLISLGSIIYFSEAQHVPGTNPGTVKMIKDMMIPNGLETMMASFGQILTAGCRALADHVFPAVVIPLGAWTGLLVGVGLGVSQAGIPGFAVALALGQAMAVMLLWFRWSKKSTSEAQQLFSGQDSDVQVRLPLISASTASSTSSSVCTDLEDQRERTLSGTPPVEGTFYRTSSTPSVEDYAPPQIY